MAGKEILEKGMGTRISCRKHRDNRKLYETETVWMIKAVDEIFPQDLFNSLEDCVWFKSALCALLNKYGLKKARMIIMYLYRMKEREIAKACNCSIGKVSLVVVKMKKDFKKLLKNKC